MLERRRLHRLIGGMAAAATALTAVAGMVAAVPAPATAATRTDVPYLLFSSAFGTRVKADQAGFSSGPSAYISSGCTHKVPLSKTNDVSGVDTGTSGITIGAVDSVARSYRAKMGGLASTVSRAASDVADVEVGDPSTLQLQIKALHGVSTAWANKKGFHAGSSLSLGDTALVGSDASQFQQVSDLLNGPTSQVLTTLTQNGPIVIPGLAQISLGAAHHRVAKRFAFANTTALVIDVFQSSSQTKPAPGDTRITVGRSFARIAKYDYSGIFGGEAYGAQATLLNGVANVGKNVEMPLRCEGTAGKVRSEALAALTLPSGNPLALSTVESDVYGTRGVPKGGATDWTSSRIAEVDLGGGQLVIKGIYVKTKAWRGADGKLHRRVYRSIGSITANGQTYAAPAPGQSLTIPSLATITVPKATWTRTGVGATALRLTVLDNSAGDTVVDLANSRVTLKR
jgi:hypothetical protein